MGSALAAPRFVRRGRGAAQVTRLGETGPMKVHELEALTLQVLDRVTNGQPIEDRRVELKGEWIDDHGKAARQIAGLANASQGDDVLWLIGVDPRLANPIRGADHMELANWWPKVSSFFNELAPSLQDVNVPHQQKTVVALLFETDRRPFTVKHVGTDRLEVPWRDGTRTRSARRSDLLRLLAPLVERPVVEPRWGQLSIMALTAPNETPKWQWSLIGRFYVETLPDTTIVMPDYRCEARLDSATVPEFSRDVPGLRVVDMPTTETIRGQLVYGEGTSRRGQQQLIVDASGLIEVHANWSTDPVGPPGAPVPTELDLDLRLGVVHIDDPLTAQMRLARDPEESPGQVKWKFKAV
jgi:hypothetical protein